MGYVVSINIPTKDCKIHKDDCSSIRQVIGNRASDNQKYSDVLDNCEEAIAYAESNGFSDCKCCGHCKPECC